jgi:PIN domain nuclease of toxin-antitoxin system
VSPLLLDTCAAIWIAANAKLGSEATRLVEEAVEAECPVYLSPITAWEVGLLVSRGRLRLDIAPLDWFEQLAATPAFRVAALTPRILVAAHFLPGTPPNDPADRIIAATARDLDATLVTRDGLLLTYGQRGHIRVQAC